MMGPLLALVDSGADFCLFDGELSYLLDLDLAKLVPMEIISEKAQPEPTLEEEAKLRDRLNTMRGQLWQSAQREKQGK